MDQFQGIPLLDEGRHTGGAVLYLQEPARKSLTYTDSSGWKAEVLRGGRTLILRGVGGSGTDEVLQQSLDAAQICLDVWAIKGAMARTLGDPEERHVVWDSSADSPVLRIWVTGHLSIQMEARGEARNADGSPILSPPPPPDPWHPSFRYFRLGQATTDLVDAFRNYYLALESLLSAIEPMALHSDGRPREREADWLPRALRSADHLTNLNEYVVGTPTGDPVSDLIRDFYSGARTHVFHAKTGAAIMLPHDETTRRLLRETIHQMRSFYTALVRARFNISPQSGGLSVAGFNAMTKDLHSHQSVYISPVGVDVETIEAGELPEGTLSLQSTYGAKHESDYFAASVGILDLHDHHPLIVRQVGLLLDGTRVGMYEDLEGELELDGFTRLEVVAATRGENPSALGTRYKT